MWQPLLDYNPEFDAFLHPAPTPSRFVSPGAFDESEELEFAADFLEASSLEENREATLDRFVTGLIRRVEHNAQDVIPDAGVRSALSSLLKRAASRTSMCDQNVARVFGLELEGLSPEDQEFEIAKQFVRFAAAAARQALALHNAPPANGARRAFALAARRHAPGLLSAVPQETTRIPLPNS